MMINVLEWPVYLTPWTKSSISGHVSDCSWTIDEFMEEEEELEVLTTTVNNANKSQGPRSINSLEVAAIAIITHMVEGVGRKMRGRQRPPGIE